MNWRDASSNSCLSQRLDAIVERADARQHQRPRVADLLGPLRDAHVRADLEQGLVDAAQVAGTVVNQSYHARRIVRGGTLGKPLRMAPHPVIPS